jgi:glycosyltransferase involved in cell wall biosynthesis
MSIEPKLSIEQCKFGSAGNLAFSAVITLYNEERNVEPLTRNLISAFRKQFSDLPFELVLVLNGPIDRTPEIAGTLAREFKEITLVTLNPNQGYGGGLLAGLAAARGSLVGIFDGDEQIESADVARLFAAALAEPCDLVKARRVSREDGWQRLVITSLYNLLFKLMFGPISDDINGKPKILSRAAYEKLNLQAKDWFIDAEIMTQAKWLGLTVREIPVKFRRRRSGSSNVRFETILEFLRNMWKQHHAKK